MKLFAYAMGSFPDTQWQAGCEQKKYLFNVVPIHPAHLALAGRHSPVKWKLKTRPYSRPLRKEPAQTFSQRFWKVGCLARRAP